MTSTSVPAPAAGTLTPPASSPVTVASPEISSYPVKMTGPDLASRPANTEMSAFPVFLSRESCLARWRCSAISRRKPSSSTWRPCSLAISRVRSIGKP